MIHIGDFDYLTKNQKNLFEEKFVKENYFWVRLVTFGHYWIVFSNFRKGWNGWI